MSTPQTTITFAQFKALADTALDHSGEDVGKQAIAALDKGHFKVNTSIFDQSAFNETVYNLEQRIHIAIDGMFRGGVTSRRIDLTEIKRQQQINPAPEDGVVEAREEHPDIAALLAAHQAREIAAVVPEDGLV